MTEQPPSDEAPGQVPPEWLIPSEQPGAESPEGAAEWLPAATVTYDRKAGTVNIQRSDGTGATLRIAPEQFDAFLLGLLEGQEGLRVKDEPDEP